MHLLSLKCSQCLSTFSNQFKYFFSTNNFKIKKVLLVSKISRYQFEKTKHPELTESQLENYLRNRGSDFNLILYHHYVHKGIENSVRNGFEAVGVETKLVYRHQYTNELVSWADCVVTTGGDGTFLLAAAKIADNSKPIVGFNSDPLRSKGQLCLPAKYSVEVKEAINKIIHGKFKWKFRKRIRITLSGNEALAPPIELHNQQVKYHELRYLDMDPTLWKLEKHSEDEVPTRVLPFLALNEVFIGECISARVSQLSFGFNEEKMVSCKCSGLIASTGTGSTSWTYSVNKLTNKNTEDILAIVREETGLPIKDSDPQFVRKITDNFNQMLIIDPEESRMVYTVRDVMTSPFLKKDEAVTRPRGLARTIDVKSQCFDASLVVDGSLSFSFNDGMSAYLQVRDSDALRTVTLHEDLPDPDTNLWSYKH